MAINGTRGQSRAIKSHHLAKLEQKPLVERLERIRSSIGRRRRMVHEAHTPKGALAEHGERREVVIPAQRWTRAAAARMGRLRQPPGAARIRRISRHAVSATGQRSRWHQAQQPLASGARRRWARAMEALRQAWAVEALLDGWAREPPCRRLALLDLACNQVLRNGGRRCAEVGDGGRRCEEVGDGGRRCEEVHTCSGPSTRSKAALSSVISSVGAVVTTVAEVSSSVRRALSPKLREGEGRRGKAREGEGRRGGEGR